MEKLISIIVPVYKVEKYIRQCVDSLISQTYKNLEIILVDDGSPDKCGEICDSYAEKDSRIKVVHKENGGLSDARNAGMEVATGEYVCFVDSDDYVSQDFVACLYDIMVSEKSDIVECDIVRFNEGETVKTVDTTAEIDTYEKVEALRLLIQEKHFRQHVWNKLYKAEIALQVKFEKGKLNEDEFWTYQVFSKAKTVTKTTRKLYYYLQRESSIMGNAFNLRRLDALEAMSHRQKFIDSNYPQLSTIARVMFFGSCIFACQSAMKFLKGKEKVQAKKIIRKYVEECRLTKDELNDLDGSIKGWFSFADKAFMLCCRIRSITGIGF